MTFHTLKNAMHVVYVCFLLNKRWSSKTCVMIVVKSSSLEEIPPLKPWQLTVTAGIAASGAAAISHTLDTAKTRSQATIIPRVISSRLDYRPNTSSG